MGAVAAGLYRLKARRGEAGDFATFSSRTSKFLGAFSADPDDTRAVKIVREETLISCGPFAKSDECAEPCRKLVVASDESERGLS